MRERGSSHEPSRASLPSAVIPVSTQVTAVRHRPAARPRLRDVQRNLEIGVLCESRETRADSPDLAARARSAGPRWGGLRVSEYKIVQRNGNNQDIQNPDSEFPVGTCVWKAETWILIVRALKSPGDPRNIALAHGRTVPGRRGPSPSDAPHTSSAFTRLRNAAALEQHVVAGDLPKLPRTPLAKVEEGGE